jgi:hypothetical protein
MYNFYVLGYQLKINVNVKEKQYVVNKYISLKEKGGDNINICMRIEQQWRL